jgi:hypothetical protein
MQRIKTLVLYSRGAPKRNQIVKDTFLRGALNVPYNYSLPNYYQEIAFGRKLSNLFLDPYRSLGYVNDWREAIKLNSKLEVFECNISDLIAYKGVKRKIKDYPLIIILHSATGDDVDLLLKTAHWYHERRGKLAIFLGNEYDLLQSKIELLRQTGAEFICSQLPIKAAKFIYGDLKNIEVLEMPHALNEKCFYPPSTSVKKNKIGFVGAKYPKWIGDSERNDFIFSCQKLFPPSETEIRIGKGNVCRLEWARFLQTISGTIGAEAGTYYLDKQGRLIQAAKRAFETEGLERFSFSSYANENNIEYVNGKAISSRHFEPIGTKTVQILLEGDYNGILKANVHYIQVKKDLSDIHERIIEYKDKSRRNEIANLTYEFVLDCHTYKHRVDKLIYSVI